MRLADAPKADRHLATFEFEDPYSCGRHFSHMWKHRIPNSVLLSAGVLGLVSFNQQEIVAASRALAERVREICLFDKRRHYAHDAWITTCDDGSFSAEIHRLHEREPHHDIPIERLSAYFYFKNSQIVVQFLEQHRFLIEVLFGVREKFVQYFGSDSRTSLEVFTDPDDENSDSKLFALILTSLHSSEASARLDQLDQEWWLEQPYEVKRAMNLDIDYVDDSL